ncbi:anther-specific protein BCP1 [Humulus lupulus]|uniref:anther-specific protein BCP1 n=1 Tax=Humulus lupulus TaxID=3486 RepID=UPI002B40DFC8|nr:anther-specific protein BCP1 [Humulus lupulus]
MARPVVIMALLAIAFVGLVSADGNSEIIKGGTGAAAAAAPLPAAGPSNDNEIGNTDGDGQADDVAEAPVGGPVPPGAFSPTDSPSGGASGLVALSAASGTAAVALVAGFLF